MEKFEIVRNVITAPVRELIQNTLTIIKNAEYFLNDVPSWDKDYFCDKDTIDKNCWPVYGASATEGLLLSLLPTIEQITGKKLFPTYSYARIYWPGGKMWKHRDRPSCEFSASICISTKGDPWPILFDGVEVVLNPGDMVVYKGMELLHWREEYTGIEQIQTFLHYVDQNGPHASYKFDQRKMLGLVIKDN
jgi:hypothetical protein